MKAQALVHLEPPEFRRMEAERCSVCNRPTRYWLTPHIPLCLNCAGIFDAEANADEESS